MNKLACFTNFWPSLIFKRKHVVVYPLIKKFVNNLQTCKKFTKLKDIFLNRLLESYAVLSVNITLGLQTQVPIVPRNTLAGPNVINFFVDVIYEFLSLASISSLA